MIKNFKVPVYVINLKKRPERLQSIQQEFYGRNEFKVNLVEAIENINGAMGLWQTIRSIFEKNLTEEFIILCEDDHQFTEFYSQEFLHDCIIEGSEISADILLGGVSWFNEAAQISANLFSVETFSATQFVVVYKKFYEQILNAEFGESDSADYKMAAISTKKFIIYPFLSIQKEFGYSDATSKNNNFGRVTAIFNSSDKRLNLLSKIWNHYRYHPIKSVELRKEIIEDNITIPVYVIPDHVNIGSFDTFIQQFENKTEFDPILVKLDNQDTENKGFLYLVQEIIRIAIANNEKYIIFCTRDHQFTSSYTKEFFYQLIASSQSLNAKVLCLGTYKFGSSVALTEDLFWIDWFINSPFTVLFQGAFESILNLPQSSKLSLSTIFNSASSNKFLIFPPFSKSFLAEHDSSNNDDILDFYKRLNFLKNEHIHYVDR